MLEHPSGHELSMQEEILSITESDRKCQAVKHVQLT